MAVQDFYNTLATNVMNGDTTAVGNQLTSDFTSYGLDRTTYDKTSWLSALTDELGSFTFNTVTNTVQKTTAVGANTQAYVQHAYNVTDTNGNTITTNINTLDMLVPNGASYKMSSSIITNRAYSKNGTPWNYATLAVNVSLCQMCGDYSSPL